MIALTRLFYQPLIYNQFIQSSVIPQFFAPFSIINTYEYILCFIKIVHQQVYFLL